MIHRHAPRFGWIISGKGFTLRLDPAMPKERADSIASVIAAYERGKSGGFVEALAAFGAERDERGEQAGATTSRLNEGAGDRDLRPADWQHANEVAPKKKRAG